MLGQNRNGNSEVNEINVFCKREVCWNIFIHFIKLFTPNKHALMYRRNNRTHSCPNENIKMAERFINWLLLSGFEQDTSGTRRDNPRA